jgi:hypothetical protein
MEIGLFARKSLTVEAIQVSLDNMDDVARWCGGVVKEHPPKQEGQFTKKYIQVDVLHPLSKKQTRAYVGDWILKSKQGFKIYANNAFQKGFEHLATVAKEN